MFKIRYFCPKIIKYGYYTYKYIVILYVYMPQSRKNKKSCILTDSGRKKLISALNKKYPNGYEFTEILSDMLSETNRTMDRNLISEIIQESQKSSNYQTLDDLFSFLNIDLEDSDYYNPPRNTTSNKNNNLDFTIPLSPQEIIKQAVKELNYQAQIRKFEDFLDLENHNRVGAFLIYGKPQYGQRWLINRLCFEVPHFINPKCETLPLKRYRHDISRLWQDLAQKFGSNSNSPQDIVEAIYQHWQSQSVIICFYHFNYKEICGQYLHYIISIFWQPLVKKTRESKSSKYSLLLFFIDESGCNKDALGIPIIHNFDINAPWNICELDELSCFKIEHLNRWLGKHQNIFEPVKDKGFETINDEVMKYNQTTPEEVLDKVCSYFELTWYDIEKTLPIRIEER